MVEVMYQSQDRVCAQTTPRYLRRWWRVRRIIFLCFFFRIRLRRFLMSEPTTADATAVVRKTALCLIVWCGVSRERYRKAVAQRDGP